MSRHESHQAENRVLGALPRSEYVALAKHLEIVRLDYKQILYEPGKAIEHVYFPTSGVVSWLTILEDGSEVEAATIGNEGMTGFGILLSADAAPARVVVQVPGAACRVPSVDLKSACKRKPALSRVMQCYFNAFLLQVIQSVACNLMHPIDQRFCRWLLMTQDRVQADQLPLTHELVARMLGVRRASITEAARKLQKAGLIHYVHGKITVVDRAGLEAASCECYRAVRNEFDRLLV